MQVQLVFVPPSLLVDVRQQNIDRCPVEAELPKSATEVGDPGWVLTA